MSEELRVAALTLRVSSTALLIALAAGVPLGTWLGLAPARRRAVLMLANTGMGLPPVLAGLVIAMLLWRSGPLGFTDLLYTPGAMIAAQAVLAFPIVTGLTAAAVQQVGPRLPAQLAGLGAGRLQIGWLVVRQARLPLVAAATAAGGRLLGEVGASIMVGGNIKGETRVLTTAMVLETRTGDFDAALRLGLILLAMSLSINALVTWAQQRGARPAGPSS